MLSESNFYTLKHYKLSRTEKNRRLTYLSNTVSSLRAYKSKARPYKRNTIEKLIVKYESLLIRIGEK